MNLTNRQRKLLKIVGFTVLALVVFIFAWWRTLPYERIKDRMVEELSAKFDVEIGDVRPGFFPGNMVIESMMLKTRPKKKSEKAAVIFFEKVEVDFGLLAAIGGSLKVDVTASVPGGTVDVGLEESKAGRRIEIHTEGLALGMLPWVKEAVGLPMQGPLHVDAKIWLPEKKWKNADGEVSFSCTGCTVGDGKTTLSLTPTTRRKSRRSKNAAIFASQGITVPKLKLGVASGKLIIKKGEGKFESFGAKSKDGWLKVTEGPLKFSDPVGRSTLPACLRFALSEELKEREKKFGSIGMMLPERSRQDDGSFAIPLKGTLSALRPNVRKRCKGAKGDTSGSDSKLSRRPTITAPKVAPKPVEPPETNPAIKDEQAAAAKDDATVKALRGVSGPTLSTDKMKNGALKAAKDAEGSKDDDDKEEGEGEGEEGEGENEGEGEGEGEPEGEGEGEGENGEPAEDEQVQ